MKYREFLSMPKHCIYALVCHENKRFMVGHTHDLFVALYRINKDLETPRYLILKNDIKNVDIEILNTGIQDVHSRKLLLSKYVDEYLEKGYQQYFPSSLVRYTIHSDIILYKRKQYICVYIKDTRKRKVVVGLFDTLSDKNKFISRYYKNNKVSGIYYSNNKITQTYLVEKGYQIQE